MFGIQSQCNIEFDEEYYDLESYQGSIRGGALAAAIMLFSPPFKSSAATSNCRSKKRFSYPVSVARAAFRTT